jgi:hypothetical protein
MKNLRLHITALLIGMTFFLVGCDKFKNKPGSGGCEYENLTEDYRIDKTAKTNDTNFSIRFVNTMRPNLTRELNRNQVKADIPEFNDTMIKDTSQIYMITVDIITSGSCNPEIITGIELKNGV